MVSKLNSTSKKILEEANNGKIFLLDGATGTFLQENGLEPGGSPELMNIENDTRLPKNFLQLESLTVEGKKI